VNSRAPHHASTSADARYKQSKSAADPKRRVLKIVLFVLLAIVVWFGIRSAIVAVNLYMAQNLVSDLQAEAQEGDLKAVAATTGSLRFHTVSAAAGTADPTWRLAELIPALGQNLHAVRMLAESANDIVVNVASPGADIAASFDLKERDPETGGFDLAPFEDAKVVAADIAPVLADSTERIGSINTAEIASPLRDVVDQFNGIIADVTPFASSAEPIVNLVSAALGADGPRDYLLAFQNNAESTALGGSAASYTLMHTDGGAISTAAQGNSGDFEEGVPVDVAVDQSALDIYGEYLINHINTSTSRPDFPTAASIMSAFWQRDKGITVDGVISIDPIALGLILNATGPITLTTGDVVNSENAVDLFTNGIYKRYPSYEEAPKADAFFEEAASTIVDKVTSGDFDIGAMISSLADGIDQGSIMVWSAAPEEQAALAGMRIQGVLPATNEKETVIGVYFRDTSKSKIDYYLSTSTATTTDVCSTAETPTFTTSVTLHSNLDEATAKALPDYVKSDVWGSKKFRTEVFVYGPIGSSAAGSSVIQEGLETVPTGVYADLNRPVVSFGAYLAPGETTTVQVTFTGAPGAYGPLEVRGTPMINTTRDEITQTAPCA
jgi:hypothetical protein